MATPVYGKQYIRFAETGLCDGAESYAQFTLVEIDNAAGTEPPSIVTMTGAGEAFGVLQQDVPAIDEERAVTLPRLGTVATSGLLLIAADQNNLQAQGDALAVDGSGKSSSAGGDVTLNATTPTVRQVVTIGNENHVLVSFN